MLSKGQRELGTVDACPEKAGFSIFAFRGIMVERDRESQLNGVKAGAQQGLKNINGRNVVIAVK